MQGRNLLLATDGKPHSAKAIELAMEMAQLASSKLFIMYVVSSRNESVRSRVIKDGMSVLQDLKQRRADRGLDITTLLEGGPPHQAIVSRPSGSRQGPSSSAPPGSR